VTAITATSHRDSALISSARYRKLSQRYNILIPDHTMSDTDRPRPTILVVDDDESLRDLLRRMFESVQYQVILASNAQDAISTIGVTPPDIILTDIYMPEADGFELINWLRKNAAAIPVIAMSGTATPRYDQLSIAENLGAIAVIEKPFRQAQIIETIDRILAKRGLPSRA
jgi:CheY-like chemotaxis protein